MAFTIVGEFEGVEQARGAHERLRRLFLDIQEQRSAVPWRNRLDLPPTWPEVEISTAYGIAWDKSLDWIESPDRQVTQFMNYVFIASRPAKTRQYPDTIEALLEQMASRVLVKGSMEGRRGEWIILTAITCTAPDELAAVKVANEINLYLGAKDVEFLIPPWEAYCPALDLEHTDVLIKPRAGDVDPVSLQQAVEALYRCQKARMEQRPLIVPEQEAIAALYALADQGYVLPHAMDGALLAKLSHDVGGVSTSSALGAVVKAEERTLHAPEMLFFNPEAGIPAIYRYLENEACTGITVQLESVPYASRRVYI